MSGKSSFRRLVAGAAVVLCLAGCSQIIDTHGYAPTDGDLSEVEVGRDTRSTVEAIIGRPSATGLLDDRGWYYVKSEFRQFGWREPKEISREVVAVSFDDQGIVENVERFGIQDGQIVALSRRVTDSNTTGVSFIQQLFGSLGNFNPATLLNDG